MSKTETVSPLRQRMIEDMAARKLNPHTQRSHIHSCKRFAAWLKRSPDTATADEVRRFQLHLVESGASIGNRNRIVTGVRFLFRVTLRRHDLAAEIWHMKEPQKLPPVLSPEEVKRVLAMATSLKARAMLTLAYGCGLRASEVVRLRACDIDSDQMIIRIVQWSSATTSRPAAAARRATSAGGSVPSEASLCTCRSMRTAAIVLGPPPRCAAGGSGGQPRRQRAERQIQVLGGIPQVAQLQRLDEQRAGGVRPEHQPQPAARHLAGEHGLVIRLDQPERGLVVRDLDGGVRLAGREAVAGIGAWQAGQARAETDTRFFRDDQQVGGAASGLGPDTATADPRVSQE